MPGEVDKEYKSTANVLTQVMQNLILDKFTAITYYQIISETKCILINLLHHCIMYKFQVFDVEVVSH